MIASENGGLQWEPTFALRTFYTPEDAVNVKDHECVNGLGNHQVGGWETQYCHIKKGSVQVKTADIVRVGTVLGPISLSGRAQHTHFHLSFQNMVK